MATIRCEIVATVVAPVPSSVNVLVFLLFEPVVSLYRAKVYVLVILLISVLYNLPRCWEVSVHSLSSTVEGLRAGYPPHLCPLQPARLLGGE